MAEETSQPATSHSAAEATKRKAEDGPNGASKKSKQGGEQQTIEEAMQPGSVKKDAGTEKGTHETKDESDSKENGNQADDAAESAGTEAAQGDTGEASGAIKEDKEREATMPSNLLEKGIIYFFTRGRVGVEDVESVGDLQRSHFVLRPIPDGGKIGDGKIDDLKNARLIALPKKVWPKSGRDRFMAFVESANASIKDLKDNFMQGSDYETRTMGTRHTPAVTPVGEGVYAITSTGDGGESHLVYMLTIPDHPGKLQEDIGIREKGSFVLSLKNPEAKGPANASLDQKPEYPKEFIEEFRNRSWMPVQPKHLDYANAQMLLIGEDLENGHALEATKKDEQDDKKETPKEEIEKLEHEDEIRVKHLKGDDTIYADLGISKSEYPAVATTW